jgi:hypothetical protein
MASSGMAEIPGRVGRPHAELTHGLNTRAISAASARITSLLVVDCAWEFAKNAGDPRTIPSRLVGAARGGATLRVAVAVKRGTGAALRRCSLTS